jgi:nucleotide-binding universal stress UspA family protein
LLLCGFANSGQEMLGGRSTKMYKHILIATDGSEVADKAVLHGLTLAKAVNASVTLLTVTEPIWNAFPGEMAIAFPYEDYQKAMAANADRILASVADAAKTKNVSFTVKHVKDQFPVDGIISAAQEGGCDLIVMASHGRRGLKRMMLGSQAAAVVVSSTIPVLIYREPPSS